MGNMFHYDNPLIAMLAKVGNMILVSLFWLITCVPVLTIIPASAALYHTTVKIVRGSGNGVARDYFVTLKDNLKQGAVLSAFCVVLGLLLYTSIDFGWQLSYSGVGIVYLIVGLGITLAICGMLALLPPVLSRFEGSVFTHLRLAGYLALKRPLRTLFMLVLFALAVLACWYYPVLVLLLPGVYTDLICSGVEKTLAAYMKESGLSVPNGEKGEEDAPALEDLTALELAAAFEEKDKAP